MRSNDDRCRLGNVGKIFREPFQLLIRNFGLICALRFGGSRSPDIGTEDIIEHDVMHVADIE